MGIGEIVDFFWPILEKDNINIPKKKHKVDDVVVASDSIQSAYDLAHRYFDIEEKRLSTVESKSIVFVGTLSVITGIIVSLLKDLSNLPFYYTIIFVISLIYFCRALIFSIKALKRGTYYSIGFKDLNINETTNTDYLKKMIVALSDFAENNSITINHKVDMMTMAQAYFVRGIITVLLASFVVFFEKLINNIIDIKLFLTNLNKTMGLISISNWVIIIIGILFLAIIITLVCLYRKINNLKIENGACSKFLSNGEEVKKNLKLPSN